MANATETTTEATAAPETTSAPSTSDAPASTPANVVEGAPKLDQERRATALAKVKREAAAVRKSQEAFKAEQAAHQLSLQKASEYDRLQKIAKEDPLEFLKAAGIDFDDAVRRKIKGSAKSPEELAKIEVDKAIAKMQKDNAEAQRKSAEVAQERQAQQIIASTKTAISQAIKSNSDKFELVGALGGGTADLIWSRMEEHYNATFEKNGVGEVLEIEQALATVEAELEEQLDKQFLGTKKMSALLAKRQTAEKAASEADKKKVQPKAAPTKPGSPSKSEATVSTQPLSSYARAKAQTKELQDKFKAALAKGEQK